MDDNASSFAGRRPDSLREAVEGRFASLVHIMRGRWSPLSRLGVLELDAGSLSLHDARGRSMFSVPAGSVQVRQQRRLAVHQVFFQIRADERWWYLVVHVPTKYERRSTRDLVERYSVRELAPRPGGMTEENHLRITKNPLGHQLLWKVCWLEALNGTGDV